MLTKEGHYVLPVFVLHVGVASGFAMLVAYQLLESCLPKGLAQATFSALPIVVEAAPLVALVAPI